MADIKSFFFSPFLSSLSLSLYTYTVSPSHSDVSYDAQVPIGANTNETLYQQQQPSRRF